VESKAREEDMLKAGPAKKVSIYVGEDHQYHGQSLYAAILNFLFYHGISGASVVRGIAGFGADHHLHTTRIEVLTADLPIKVEFIESAEKVEEVLPKLHELAGTGLIEVQDTLVVKPAEMAKKKELEESLPALKRESKAKLMRIFIGETDKWGDQPLHKALVESMRANDIAGVTVYQGILGYGANRRIHQDSGLHLSHDRPVMLSVVETEEKLQAYFPILDQMVQQGLVVLSDVDIIKYTHNFATAERRKEART
jgi:PII-like signaling protein